MQHCQLSWCSKRSNLILDIVSWAAGELCVLIVITVQTSLPPSYINRTTHCSKMELSAYTKDCFSTTERSFQHNERLFLDNKRYNGLTERTIVSRQGKERSLQQNERTFQDNGWKDRFKTTNRAIVYTKEWSGTIV